MKNDNTAHYVCVILWVLIPSAIAYALLVAFIFAFAGESMEKYNAGALIYIIALLPFTFSTFPKYIRQSIVVHAKTNVSRLYRNPYPYLTFGFLPEFWSTSKETDIILPWMVPVDDEIDTIESIVKPAKNNEDSFNLEGGERVLIDWEAVSGVDPTLVVTAVHADKKSGIEAVRNTVNAYFIDKLKEYDEFEDIKRPELIREFYDWINNSDNQSFVDTLKSFGLRVPILRVNKLLQSKLQEESDDANAAVDNRFKLAEERVRELVGKTDKTKKLTTEELDLVREYMRQANLTAGNNVRVLAITGDAELVRRLKLEVNDGDGNEGKGGKNKKKGN